MLIEIPVARHLGKNGPIPQALLDRLADDLESAQCLATDVRTLLDSLIEITDREDGAIVHGADALAEKLGRLLEPWTGTGYFADGMEGKIKLPEAQEPDDAND